MQIFLIIDGPAYPADRSLYIPSLAGDQGSVKNTHATAALGDEANINI